MTLEWTRSSGVPWRLSLEARGLPLLALSHWIPVVPWYQPERGTAQLSATLAPTTDGRLRAEGTFGVEHLGLSHRRLASAPIEDINASLRGELLVDLVHRRVDLGQLQAQLGGIYYLTSGWLAQDEARTAFDLRFQVPSVSCEALKASMPSTVAGAVRDLVLSGTIAADLRLAVDTSHLEATQLQVAVDNRCRVVADHMANSIIRFRQPFVQRVLEPQGPRAFITGPGSAAWVELGMIAPSMVNAVISREDGRFYRHNGFDVGEIRGAIIRDIAARRFVYGASTLSMQLAKNIFLAREKTLVRKVQEVVLTWYLEQSLGKDGILELYLNVVEFGPGIYGIGPAARFYFNREPAELTPLQSIYLATLLPNPGARFGNFRRGRVPSDTLARLRLHARSMSGAGLLSWAEYQGSLTEELRFRPASETVRGALTQNVENDFSDAMAAALPPPPPPPPRPAQPPSAGTPPNAEASSSEDADPEGATPADAAPPPINLRTGGTL